VILITRSSLARLEARLIAGAYVDMRAGPLQGCSRPGDGPAPSAGARARTRRAPPPRPPYVDMRAGRLRAIDAVGVAPSAGGLGAPRATPTAPSPPLRPPTQGICSWVPGTGVPDLSCADDVDESPCGRMSHGGWALAGAAALLHGSYAAFVKARRVQAGRVRRPRRPCVWREAPAFGAGCGRLARRPPPRESRGRPFRTPPGQVPAYVFNAWACLGVVICSLPLAWLVGFRVSARRAPDRSGHLARCPCRSRAHSSCLRRSDPRSPTLTPRAPPTKVPGRRLGA
jgi:hypothetical protein